MAGALALAILGAACGGSSTPGSTPSDGGPSASPVVSQRPVDPNFDEGQTIYITDKGFHPAWLVAVVNRPITWVNQTNRVVDLRFDNLGSDAQKPSIAPGKTFAWRPTATLSIDYHDAANPKMQGKIQVEPEYMPGETPFTDSQSVPTVPATP
jgi:hypothetical protein